MGPEKFIVFSKINLLTLLRDLPNIDATQLLWKKFKICMICYTMKRFTLVVQSNLKKRQNKGSKIIQIFIKLSTSHRICTF